MAERERTLLGHRRLALVGAALTGGLLLAGCAHAPVKDAQKPTVGAPQTMPPAGPSPPAPATEEPVAEPVHDNKPVVIEEGGDASRADQGLAAAAAAEHQRRLA